MATKNQLISDGKKLHWKLGQWVIKWNCLIFPTVGTYLSAVTNLAEGKGQNDG